MRGALAATALLAVPSPAQDGPPMVHRVHKPQVCPPPSAPARATRSHHRGWCCQACEKSAWGQPICLEGNAETTLVNVTWARPAGQLLPDAAAISFGNPNRSAHLPGWLSGGWCANISVRSARGLSLQFCDEVSNDVREPPPPSAPARAPPLADPRRWCTQDGCPSCGGSKPGTLVAGDPKYFRVITSKAQLQMSQGTFFSLSWDNTSVVPELAWAEVRMLPIPCTSATFGQTTSQGFMITLGINSIFVAVALVGVTAMWLRATRSQRRMTSASGAGGRSRTSSDAISQSVQQRDVSDDPTGRRQSVQSILVESALVEKNIWRMNFMKRCASRTPSPWLILALTDRVLPGAAIRSRGRTT